MTSISTSSTPSESSGRRATGRSSRGCGSSSGTPTTWARSNATGTTYLRDPHLLAISLFLVDYPFAERLYPGALEVIERLESWGPTVILSDGDVIFQPRKVERSGLWEAVAGDVLIYIHKEQMLADVEQRYPARHYVMVDDKPRILAAMKQVWGDRLTTVLPRQGHYALDPTNAATYPSADMSLDHIGDLIDCDLDALRGARRHARGG